jgi:hypothetical protein
MQSDKVPATRVIGEGEGLLWVDKRPPNSKIWESALANL